MPVSTTVSTGQYHSAVICAQRTRRAAPRRKGRSVRRISLVGLRSDASTLATFQMAANCAAAKQEPRCLQPIQSVQAVDCISVSSTVSGCPAFCCNDPSYLPLLVRLQCCLSPSSSSTYCNLWCALQQLHSTLLTCGPRSASHAVHSSPCYPVASLVSAIHMLLLQPTPTLPLVLKVAHHHHPLYPPPRCLGTSSDLHTNAATCPFRRAYRRAYRMYHSQECSAALQRVHRWKFSVGSIHPLVLRETSLWHQLESRRVRYSRRRPRYAASSSERLRVGARL